MRKRSSMAVKGFTLIELVVVITILSIVSVVAATKTMNISSDARIAVLKSVRANLQSSFDLFYAKREMVNSRIITTEQDNSSQDFLVINGQPILINEHDGYPLFRVKPLSLFEKELNALVDIDAEIYPIDGKFKTSSKLFILPNPYGGFRVYFKGHEKQVASGKWNCYVHYQTAKQYDGAPTVSKVVVETSDC